MPANTLHISEYNFVTVQSSLMQAMKVPPLAQGTVGITASTTRAGVLGSTTNTIRLHATAACCVAFGDSTVQATTASIPMASGDTEYFQVTPSTYVAVIADS